MIGFITNYLVFTFCFGSILSWWLSQGPHIINQGENLFVKAIIHRFSYPPIRVRASPLQGFFFFQGHHIFLEASYSIKKLWSLLWFTHRVAEYLSPKKRSTPRVLEMEFHLITCTYWLIMLVNYYLSCFCSFWKQPINSSITQITLKKNQASG